MMHLQGTLDLAATHAIVRGDTTVHLCQACGALIASQTAKANLAACSACGASRWLRQDVQTGPFHPSWATHLVRSVQQLVTDQPGAHPHLEEALQRAASHTRESAPINPHFTTIGWQAPLIERNQK
jgi:hypothetical protein